MLDLLQPFEQAANVARSLGRYRIETELLYRRKYLELIIAKKNRWTPQALGLVISEVSYGFGYYRLKLLHLAIPFMISGFLVALKQLYIKQQRIVWFTLFYSSNYIEDEQCEREKTKTLKDIRNLIDSIDEVIYDGYDNGNFYIYVKYNLIGRSINNPDDLNNPLQYQKIRLNKDKDELRYFIDMLKQRNPHHNKVGFCDSIYGDNRLAVIMVNSQKKNEIVEDSPQNMRCVKVFLIDDSKEIEIEFRRDCGIIPNKWLSIFSFLIGVVLSFICSSFWFLILFYCIFIYAVCRLMLSKNIHGKYNIWKSTLYTIDLFMPVIELDQDLRDFIFHDSQGYTRFYFQLEQVLATIIISILLPILFFTGL